MTGDPTASAAGPAAGSATEASTRCSVLSARDEPLAGTATRVRGWVCLEHPSPWGRDVLDGTAFGPELTAELERATQAAGVRLMLIRRPGRSGSDAAIASRPRTVHLARTHPGGAQCTRLTVDTPRDLLDLDLSAVAQVPEDPGPTSAPPVPGRRLPGEPVDGPVTLVCTHGKRDVCCAIDGRPIAAALHAAGEPWSGHVWECSHTGGHRFAPSMIVLPSGYSYGRVSAADARAAVEGAAAGVLSWPGLRGRSCWDAAGQVAELAVRRSLPAAHADALTVADAPGEPDVRVVRHVDGRRWRVRTRTESMTPRATSCGGPPKPVSTAAVTSVARV